MKSLLNIAKAILLFNITAISLCHACDFTLYEAKPSEIKISAEDLSDSINIAYDDPVIVAYSKGLKVGVSDINIELKNLIERTANGEENTSGPFMRESIYYILTNNEISYILEIDAKEKKLIKISKTINVGIDSLLRYSKSYHLNSSEAIGSIGKLLHKK